MTSRVLIVEDEPDIVLLLKIGLELSGYSISAVRSGEEALIRLQNEPIHLLLLDIRLPGIDGWEVMRRINADPPEPDPLIVVLSAHASPATADRAFEMGCSDYITKPFEMRNLRERIAALLNKQDN